MNNNYRKVKISDHPIWHINGNWGGYYRDWLLANDGTHYLSTEDNKKYIVKCHGMGIFELEEFKQDNQK